MATIIQIFTVFVTVRYLILRTHLIFRKETMVIDFPLNQDLTISSQFDAVFWPHYNSVPCHQLFSRYLCKFSGFAFYQMYYRSRLICANFTTIFKKKNGLLKRLDRSFVNTKDKKA